MELGTVLSPNSNCLLPPFLRCEDYESYNVMCILTYRLLIMVAMIILAPVYISVKFYPFYVPVDVCVHAHAIAWDVVISLQLLGLGD